MRLDLQRLLSESAIYGVVTISGLLVIVAAQTDSATTEALVKVVATVFVFWLAHVYAGTVAHLGDSQDPGELSGTRLARALRHSLAHSGGMLLVTLVPVVMLTLGVLGLVSHEIAIWGTLWLDVALLAVLGYFGVAGWTPQLWPRLAGALIAAALGVILILLKAWIH